MFKRVLAAIVMVFSILMGMALPAAAVQNNYVDKCGFRYWSSVDFNRPGGGNVTFNWWNITGQTPMEYRVRWFAPNGTTVIYDTGYVASTPNNPGGNPGVSRYLPGQTSSVLVNAGLAGDGCATGEIWFSIPGA